MVTHLISSWSFKTKFPLKCCTLYTKISKIPSGYLCLFDVISVPIFASISRPLPNCGQLLRDRPVGLGDNEAAGLGGVEDAPVADHGAEAFAGVDGRAGGDKLAVVREVNHVHVRPKDVWLGHRETAAGVIMANTGDDLAGLMVVHVALAAKCV